MPQRPNKRRRATLARDGWQLESAVARHAESPETFWIPDKNARDSVQVGDLAQLLFQIACDPDDGEDFNVERMWVEVTGKVDNQYLGRLRNQPASVEEGTVLDVGAEVLFNSEDIIDIRGPDNSAV